MDFLGSSGRGKSLCRVGFDSMSVLMDELSFPSVNLHLFLQHFSLQVKKGKKKKSTDLLVVLAQPFVNWEKAQLGEIAGILFQFYRLKVSLKTLINDLDWEFQGSKAEKYFDFKIRTITWEWFHWSWAVEKPGKFILKEIKWSCNWMWGNSSLSLSLGRFWRPVKIQNLHFLQIWCGLELHELCEPEPESESLCRLAISLGTESLYGRRMRNCRHWCCMKYLTNINPLLAAVLQVCMPGPALALGSCSGVWGVLLQVLNDVRAGFGRCGSDCCRGPDSR